MQNGRYRFLVLKIMACVMLAMITVRLFSLQIINGEVYYKTASSRLSAAVVNKAPRGDILDRYGNVLVSNKSGYSVLLHKASSKNEKINSVVGELVKILISTENGISDTLPISVAEPYEFVFSDDTEKENWFKSCKYTGEYINSDMTAQEVLDILCSIYEIQGYDGEQRRYVAGIRYMADVKEFSSLNPITVAENINAAAVAEIKQANLDGVSVTENYVRQYTNPGFATHILGRVGQISAEEYEKNKDKGTEKEVRNYTFELSDTVSVIDGSLYCKIGTGFELITFAGTETVDVNVHEDTTRISALAFAGSDAVRVKLPFVTTSIGHKAFFACEKLEMVVFGSYTAPNFEEEFDPQYYGTLENIPGAGDFGTYTDFDGNEVTIDPLGIIPFFMWNATGGMYSNVFYGANFIDYIGHVEDKITMVKPVNGECYDSFICDQYFDLRIDGPAAPDKSGVEAILAIKAIPERVAVKDAAIVKAARDAYEKIATLEQKALVNNYSDLVSAEQRIKALEAAEKEDGKKEEPKKEKTNVLGIIITIIIIVVALAAVAVLAFFGYKNREKFMAFLKSLKEKTNKPSEKKAEAESPAEEAPAEEAPAEEATEETTEEKKEEVEDNEEDN